MFTRLHILSLLVVMETFLILSLTPDKSDFIVNLPLVETVEQYVVSNNTDQTLTEKDYYAYGKVENVAKSIAKKYRNISQTEALRVVNIVYKEAPKHGLKPELVLGVIATESSFRRSSESGANAKGYMQVIPYWHQDKIKGRDIWNTQVNIEVGTAYLAECINKRGSYSGGLACYNGAVTPSKAEEYNVSVTMNTREMSKLTVSL